MVVTDGVRDASGKAVKATSDFESMDANNVPIGPRSASRRSSCRATHGLLKSDIISASAFTTQSVTSVMERIGIWIKASDGARASSAEPGRRAHRVHAQSGFERDVDSTDDRKPTRLLVTTAEPGAARCRARAR